MTPLERKIIDLLKEELAEERVTFSDKFLDDLGGDSLDLVEFVILLEDIWDIEINDEEAEILVNATPKEFVELLKKKGVQDNSIDKKCPCCGVIS